MKKPPLNANNDQVDISEPGRRRFLKESVAIMSLSLAGCWGYDIDEDLGSGGDPGGETPVDPEPEECIHPDGTTDGEEMVGNRTGFSHPGLLNTEADFTLMRQKVESSDDPWATAWLGMIASFAPKLDGPLRPTETVIRGGDGQNFQGMVIDMQHAYALALRWKVSGEVQYADRALEYLDGWSSTMTTLTGNSDRFLASGLYGYQWALTGEIMRTYSGWSVEGLSRFQRMLKNIFLPMCRDFLNNHNGTEGNITNYWANWDLANMCGMLAIGVFCDDADAYNEAIRYYYNGRGNGAADHAVYKVHRGFLGQWQESGRDQGHSTLGIALMSCFCEMAWNQGDDLYGYRNNRFLAGAEYVAATNYQLTDGSYTELPYTPYWSSSAGGVSWADAPVLSDSGRPHMRPCWELVYNHYVNRKGLDAPWSTRMAARTRPDGISRGYSDSPAWTTLTHTRNRIANIPGPSGLTARVINGGIQLDWWGIATAQSYELQRYSEVDCAFVTIHEVGTSTGDVRTYTDYPGNGIWKYRVVANTLLTQVVGQDVIEVDYPGGLIFHLPLNEGSGRWVVDATGGTGGAELAGAATWGAGRKGGSAVQLTNGQDSYVELPAELLAKLDDFTVALWVYAAGNPADGSFLFSFAKNDVSYFGLCARSRFDPWTHTMRAETTQTTGSYARDRVHSERFHPGRWLEDPVSGTNQVDRWTHIAFTQKGGEVALYVNGVKNQPSGEDYQAPVFGLSPFDIGATTINRLGVAPWTTSNAFNGRFEDFRVYSRALSASEVSALAAD